MIQSYITYQLLTAQQCVEINNMLTKATWADGLTTVQNMETELKKSLLLDLNSNIFVEVANVIKEATLDCFDFASTTQPLTVNSLMVTRTEINGYYAPHVDAAQLGEFSTTVFLSDENSYQGGELCLVINNKEEKIKLPPGWAVTYKTGITHRVNKVTSGTRDVAVFWVETAIKNDVVRECIRKLLLSLKLQNKLTTQLFHSSCLDAEEDSTFLLHSVLNDLRRHFSKTSS